MTAAAGASTGGHVTGLWRHPVKALGREPLDQVTLTPGQTMPGDRIWALEHEAGQAAPDTWSRCINFIRAAGSPELMAVTCQMDGDRVTLRHPRRPDLTVNPDTEADRLVAWAAPLVPEGRAAPVRVRRDPARAMTDSRTRTLSIANHASHRAVEQRLGTSLSIHRWRANIWIDGFPLWEEFDWIGREVRIGGTVLRVVKPVERCAATTANPETGARDADTLGALDSFGHQNFSVLGEVILGGDIHTGDAVALIP